MLNGLPRAAAIRARSVLRVLRDAYRYATFRYRFSDSRGVFQSFEEARCSAPSNKPIGYDDPTLASEYAKGLRLELSDYDFPALYYLTKILSSAERPLTILDFGGNVGVHYLKFRRHLDLLGVQWAVCEVPEIASIGREICEGDACVDFVSDMADLPTADVVLAIGSVQYIDDFAGMISRSGLAPTHILIGQVLVHDGPRFVTLQNGGRVYYPQYVFNRRDFIDTFAAAGFGLVETWADTSNGCDLPFHPGLQIESEGFYFANGDAAGRLPRRRAR